MISLLDRRAGPAVGDDQREGILMLRNDVHEMNVEASISVMKLGRSSTSPTLRQL